MTDVEVFRWEHRPDGLRDPIVVAAFRGWNDAGEAASFALGYLQSSLTATRFAHVDPEEFFDFQSHRPRIQIDGGALTAPLHWPEIELLATSGAAAGRDLILVNGIEPSMRWPTLCGALLDLAAELGSSTIVTLGALLADVPHTRPVRVSALAHPASLIEPLNLRRPDYHGPTGIVGVLHALAVDRGVTSLSLWAAVPHYVGAAPSPNAALALLELVEQTVGVAVDLGDLRQAVTHFEVQVSDAVRHNPQAANLVTELEQAYDSETDVSFGPLPSGDAIAAEFERFLREHGEPGPDPAG